jgi:penicillin V acylase-like amidase (Ntn superfamily)
MQLIPSTVFHNGKIYGIIVSCTDEEYQQYIMHDEINENQVSCTFLQEYIQKSGVDVKELIKNSEQNAPAGNFGFWVYAKTITIPNVKEILEYAGLDFFEFVDAYCEHLKSL